MIDKRTISKMLDYTLERIMCLEFNEKATMWDKFLAWKVYNGLKRGVILDANEPHTYRELRKDFNKAVGTPDAD